VRKTPRVAATQKSAAGTGLKSLIRNRLRGADGLRVVDSGALARSNGHPRGTAWVEIEADSILDCEVAEFRLDRLDALRPAPWEQGWSLAENKQLEPSFRLRLFGV
jgi:hypothetical protein